MPSRPQPLIAAGLVVAGIALGGLLEFPARAARQVEVTVTDDAYRPANQRASVGDRVVWRWAGSNQHPHSVTALDGRFDSDGRCGQKPDPCRAAGSVYAITFREPGTYRYRCKVHLIMLGSIEVTAATPSEQPTTRPAPPRLPGTSSTATPTPRRSSPPAAAPRRAVRSPAAVGAPPLRRYTVGRAGGFRVDYAPAPPPRLAPVPGPAVAPPAVAPPAASQSQAPFPTPSPVPTATALAVDVPTRGSSQPRDLLTGIAALSVLTSAGALSKLVLFAEPW